MSQSENSLDLQVSYRLMPLEIRGDAYSFRNNSFSGRLTRWDGSQGYIKNSKRGTPDRVALIYGRFVGIEYKSSTGRQSVEQKAAQRQIEAAGGLYVIVRRLEDFDEILQTLTASHDSKTVVPRVH